MEVDTKSITSVQELVSSLEQATLMESRLPDTNTYQLHQIRSTLLSAQRSLSLFLNHQPPPPPENSMASAVGFAGDDNDVQMGDEEDEQNSRAAMTSTAADNAEERMRDCFVQNKRPKMALYPSAAVAAEQRGCWKNEGLRDDAVVAEYDPCTTKMRSLELIYQFHG